MGNRGTASVRTLVILALLAAAVIPAPPASAMTDPYPLGANAAATEVCTLSDSTTSDETSRARTVAPDDVPLGRTGLSGVNAVLIAGGAVYTKVVVDVSRVGDEAGHFTWQYWSASGWKALTGATDATNGFSTLGVNTISFPPPADWTTAKHECNTVTPYYYLKAASTSFTTIAPKASQIALVMFNVRVHVQTEAAVPVDGITLAQASADGFDDTIYAFASRGNGDYDLALMANGALEYDLTFSPTGLLATPPINVEVGGSALADERSPPAVASYPLKVIVSASSGASITNAQVKIDDAQAHASSGKNYFFRGPINGLLSVTAPGHASTSLTQDSKLQNVVAGSTTATVVTFIGATACTGGTEIPAGSQATCSGLTPLPGSTPSSTSPADKASGTTSSRPARSSLPVDDGNEAVEGEESLVEPVEDLDEAAAPPAATSPKLLIPGLIGVGALAAVAATILVVRARRGPKKP